MRQGHALWRRGRARGIEDVADVLRRHSLLCGGECSVIDCCSPRQELRQREDRGGCAPLYGHDGVQGRQPRAPERARRRPVELRAKVAQRIEEAPAAKSIERDQRRGTGMLQSPGKFALCRKRAERGDDGADLGAGEGGGDPFRSVGDQQRDPLPTPDADGEERPGEFVDARLEAGVIETLVAKHQSLSVGRGGRHLIDQIAEGAADQVRARAVTHRASSFVERMPLLAERGDALGEVRAGSHFVAELLLQRLAGQRVIGNCGADLPLDRLHRRGAVRSDHLRGLDRPTHQLAAGHKPVYQAEPSRLPSVDQARRQQQVHRVNVTDLLDQLDGRAAERVDRLPPAGSG